MKMAIIYSPSSCSKPVWVSFPCWAQKMIFWRMLVTKQLMVAIDFHNMEKKILWKSMAAFILAQKNLIFLLASDTDQNLLHTCKHKNPCEIRFFRIRSEPLPNVNFNRIHIRYLDIRPTSKHTYPILHRTPNARATRLLIDFNGVLIPACCMRSHFIEMETFYR